MYKLGLILCSLLWPVIGFSQTFARESNLKRSIRLAEKDTTGVKIESIETSEDQQILAALLSYNNSHQIFFLDEQLQIFRRLPQGKKPSAYAVDRHFLYTARPSPGNQEAFAICRRALSGGEESCWEVKLFISKVFAIKGILYAVANGGVYRLYPDTSGHQLVEQFTGDPNGGLWAMGVHRTIFVAADGFTGIATVCNPELWKCTKYSLLTSQQREWAKSKHPNEAHFGPDSLATDGNQIVIFQGRHQAQEGLLVNIFSTRAEHQGSLLLKTPDIDKLDPSAFGGKAPARRASAYALCADAELINGRVVCSESRAPILLVY
jgi:hypothetical protein